VALKQLNAISLGWVMLSLLLLQRFKLKIVPLILLSIAAGGLFIIFTGALMVHLLDGWTLNWFGAKKGEGIEYFVLLLSLLLVIALKGSGALSMDLWLTR
jgi:putative oxidoreductase